ncbi:MAG: ATP-binding cassette domain-containing protein [Pseudomonadota bacterium]
MLVLKHLYKSFGSLQVCRDVSLSLKPGEKRVILGPNGAGKTSLFNLITGEIKADSGQILLDHKELSKKSIDARARLGIGRSYQKNNLFDGLSVEQNLSLACAHKPYFAYHPFKNTHQSSAIIEKLNHFAHMLELEPYLKQPVSQVSYGTRRRLEIASSLAQNPKILLLDEPTSGIGPEGIRHFYQLIKSLPSKLAILIIEHDIDLAFAVADTMSVLNEGQLVFEGTPGEVRTSKLVRQIYLGAF